MKIQNLLAMYLKASIDRLNVFWYFENPVFVSGTVRYVYGGYPLAVKKSSAEKRHRQSEERRLRNKSARSAVRTSVKKFVSTVQKKDVKESGVALVEMIKKLDSASRKGIISKNAASRKKSRMQKLYNSVAAAN